MSNGEKCKVKPNGCKAKSKRSKTKPEGRRWHYLVVKRL